MFRVSKDIVRFRQSFSLGISAYPQHSRSVIFDILVPYTAVNCKLAIYLQVQVRCDSESRFLIASYKYVSGYGYWLLLSSGMVTYSSITYFSTSDR